jgi:hypothetical protein
MSTSLKSCLCRSPVADSEYGGGVQKLVIRKKLGQFICIRLSPWNRMKVESNVSRVIKMLISCKGRVAFDLSSCSHCSPLEMERHLVLSWVTVGLHYSKLCIGRSRCWERDKMAAHSASNMSARRHPVTAAWRSFVKLCELLSVITGIKYTSCIYVFSFQITRHYVIIIIIIIIDIFRRQNVSIEHILL